MNNLNQLYLQHKKYLYIGVVLIYFGNSFLAGLLLFVLLGFELFNKKDISMSKKKWILVSVISSALMVISFIMLLFALIAKSGISFGGPPNKTHLPIYNYFEVYLITTAILFVCTVVLIIITLKKKS